MLKQRSQKWAGKNRKQWQERGKPEVNKEPKPNRRQSRSNSDRTTTDADRHSRRLRGGKVYVPCLEAPDIFAISNRFPLQTNAITKQRVNCKLTAMIIFRGYFQDPNLRCIFSKGTFNLPTVRGRTNWSRPI